MRRTHFWIVFVVVMAMPGMVWAQAAAETGKESDCADRVDNDGDGLADCGDSDCFSSDSCKPDGKPESSNDRCSDWIDNDGDGFVDCDDNDCKGHGINVCSGSWKGTLDSTGSGRSGAAGAGNDDLPELKDGKSVEDLIGTGDDKDGERNNIVCSDGIDNDSDGKIDCADFGCRFDPTVTVCRGNPGMRFSIVGNIAFDYDLEKDASKESAFDTRFTKLQLRSFGPIPHIQNSFYLVSMRAEKTPRLTFAMFQIPLGSSGHFLNINSGGGGLSNALVLSSAKQLLLNAPYYMSSAFEQGNGAAAEVYGPLDSDGNMHYRVFMAGGRGKFAGNVGGRYFSFDDQNFTWSAGAQLGVNIVGRHSRWDSQFMYTPSPLTMGMTVGAKYDERSQERYPAFNSKLIMRYRWLSLAAENYTKRELNFKSWQTAYNLQAGWLVWPRHILIGADYGQFLPFKPEKQPDDDFQKQILARQLEETQWRVAMHWYFWRNVGVATLIYSDRTIEADSPESENTKERKLSLTVQYRF